MQKAAKKDSLEHEQNEAIVQNELLYEVQQQEMDSLLHKLTCAIMWRRGTLVSNFSGILISPDLVLTCAHGLYNTQDLREHSKHTQERVKDNEIEVYPGQFGVMKKPFQVQKSFVPRQYQTNKDAQFDYALLKLSEDIECSQFISLDPNFDKKQGTQIAIFGYPSQYYKLVHKIQAKYQVNQWGLIRKDRVTDINKKQERLSYEISTKRGQSGSAVVWMQGERLAIVGIHRCVNPNHKSNTGILITKQLLWILRNQATKLEAQMFQCNLPLQKNSTLSYIYEFSNFEDSQYIKTSIKQFAKVNKKGVSILQKARQLFRDKKFKQMIAFCKPHMQQLIEISHVTYILLGVAHFKTLEHQAGVAYFQLGISGKCQSPLPYFCLAVYYLIEQRFKQAIDCLQKLLLIHQAITQGYALLGMAYHQLGNYQRAICLYSLVPTQNWMHNAVLFNLGQCYRLAKLNSQAIECFQKAIRIYPDDIDAYIQLGGIYLFTFPDKAYGYLQEGLKLNPESPRALLQLGKLYRNKSKWHNSNEAKAKSLLQQSFSISQKPSFLKKKSLMHSQTATQLGDYYFDHSKYETAKKWYYQAVEINIKNIQALDGLGKTYMQTRQIDQAIKVYESALIIDEKFQKAYCQLGQCWSIKRIFAKALAYFYQYLEYDRYNQSVMAKIRWLQQKQ